MNSGTGTFGKTNWRVPTANELKILINCNDQTMPSSGCSSYTSPTICNLFPNTSAGFYWSSIINSTNSWEAALIINFGNGGIVSGIKSLHQSVRCVSGP